MWTTPNFSTMNSHCVPFPDAGAPGWCVRVCVCVECWVYEKKNDRRHVKKLRWIFTSVCITDDACVRVLLHIQKCYCECPCDVWKLPTLPHTQKYTQTQKNTPQIMIFGAIMASGTPPRRRRFDVLPASFSCILLSVCARANVWEGCKCLCVWICVVQYYIYTNRNNTHTEAGVSAGGGGRERER